MLSIFDTKKTVDGVMAVFHQAIDDLRDVHDRELADAGRLEEEAAAALANANAARREAGRASRVAQALSNLVEPQVELASA